MESNPSSAITDIVPMKNPSPTLKQYVVSFARLSRYTFFLHILVRSQCSLYDPPFQLPFSNFPSSFPLL